MRSFAHDACARPSRSPAATQRRTRGNWLSQLENESRKYKTRPHNAPFRCGPGSLRKLLNMLHSLRLDYISCVLTVLGTVLLGKRLWQGWVVAAINSAVVCVIGVRTAQFGFVPANLVCIALYTSNLFTWRLRARPDRDETRPEAES